MRIAKLPRHGRELFLWVLIVPALAFAELEEVSTDSMGEPLPALFGGAQTAISGDGRFVVYNSTSVEFLPPFGSFGPAPHDCDVYRKNRATGGIKRVFDTDADDPYAFDYCNGVAISDDGDIVAVAPTLSGAFGIDDCGKPWPVLYRKSISTGDVTVVSEPVCASDIIGSALIQMTPDGRYSLLQRRALNERDGLAGSLHFRYDHDDGSIIPLAPALDEDVFDVFDMSMSDDGRYFVVHGSEFDDSVLCSPSAPCEPRDDIEPAAIYHWDRQTETLTKISGNDDEAILPRPAYASPVISGDGVYAGYMVAPTARCEIEFTTGEIICDPGAEACADADCSSRAYRVRLDDMTYERIAGKLQFAELCYRGPDAFGGCGLQLSDDGRVALFTLAVIPSIFFFNPPVDCNRFSPIYPTCPPDGGDLPDCGPVGTPLCPPVVGPPDCTGRGEFCPPGEFPPALPPFPPQVVAIWWARNFETGHLHKPLGGGTTARSSGNGGFVSIDAIGPDSGVALAGEGNDASFGSFIPSILLDLPPGGLPPLPDPSEPPEIPQIRVYADDIVHEVDLAVVTRVTERSDDLTSIKFRTIVSNFGEERAGFVSLHLELPDIEVDVPLPPIPPPFPVPPGTPFPGATAISPDATPTSLQPAADSIIEFDSDTFCFPSLALPNPVDGGALEFFPAGFCSIRQLPAGETVKIDWRVELDETQLYRVVSKLRTTEFDPNLANNTDSTNAAADIDAGSFGWTLLALLGALGWRRRRKRFSV